MGKVKPKDSATIKSIAAGRSVIGIDIGTSSVNIAQMAFHRGKFQLVRTRVVDFELKDGEDKKAVTQQAVNDALEGFVHRRNKYVCVVNCPQTSVRIVVTPYMPKEELKGAVTLEARRSIPFSLKEAVLDFNVVEQIKVKGADKFRIIVAAAPKKTIEELLSYLIPKKAKPLAGPVSVSEKSLQPLNVNVSAALPLALCLENVIERSKLKTDETLVTIEMGTTVTELNIFKNSRLQFSRKIPFSGKSITQSLTGALMTDKGKVKLSLEDAEKIKREVGIPSISENKMIDDKMSTNHVLSLIRPRVEQLANEIERSFDFYREEMRGSDVDRIVLFGGGAQLKGLPEFLSKELGLEVVIGNPLADIDMATDSVVEDQQQAQKLVLAIGAALSGMKGVNLLPEEFRNKRTKSIRKIVFQSTVVAAVAMFLVVYVPLKLNVMSAEKKYNHLQQELIALSPELTKIKDQIMIENELNSHPSWGQALKEISHIVPNNVYLEYLTMDGDKINITGRVIKGAEPAESVLSHFMVGLEDGVFRRVKLLRTSKVSANHRELQFELTCGVE